MFEVLKRYIPKGDRVIRRASRSVCVFTLVLLLPVVAAAYTVVLRSGRRIEIPSQFTVTPLTLTYERSQGINITILISSIDIPGTERANNEVAGTFLKRAEKPLVHKATPPGQRRRELTQADIEAARISRQKSEQDYERRRRELGLPSLEESRVRRELETERLRQQALQSQAEESRSEAYWRSRAIALRTEMAQLDAQVNHVRQRLAELPEYPAIGPYAFMPGVAPYFPSRHSVTTIFPNVTGHPGFMRGNNNTFAQGPGFLAFGGGATRSQMEINARIASGNFGGRIFPGRRMPFPAATVFGAPYSNYDYSSERSNLIDGLRQLEVARAGVRARWRLLEEEARRAGAQPGWLRP